MRKIGTVGMVALILFAFLPALAQENLKLGGRILKRDDQPLPNVEVRILNSTRTQFSDKDGQFVFDGLSSGKYELEFSAGGYASTSLQVELTASRIDLMVRLQEAVSQLDEVIVSADKKEQRLLSLPYSITTISGRQVNDYRLWNARELTGIVPNLYAGHSGDDRNVVSIRGITTTSYDPAVALYVDGVNQFSLDTYIPQLLDVERVEVLRGPQGTLYGRNAMGGVINVITKQPTNKTRAFVELTYGNYNQYRYAAGIQTPLVNNRLFFGATAMINGRDGFYKNEFNNKSFDDVQTVSGSYFLKYLLNSKWTITANYKNQFNQNWGAFPLVNGVEEALTNPYKLNQNAVGTMKDNTHNAALTIQHRSGRLLFSSQTAYQKNYRYYTDPLDGDFSPFDAVAIINNYGRKYNKVDVFTQEFRFSNAPSTSLLKWTAGAYAFTQGAPVKQATYFGDDAGMMGSPMTNFSTIVTSNAKNRGVAFFGQAEYPITSKLSVLAGFRYDYESKKLNVMGEFQPNGMDPMVTQPDTSAREGFSAVSPKFGLSYAIAENGRLFGNYTRGFRTGGLTGLGADPSQPPLYSYKPEYSNNLEIGYRQELLDRKLRFGLTLFYSELTDAQVPTLVLPEAITITRNTGKLLSRGIELELAAKPVKGLELNYSFGTTRARYSALKVSSDGSELDLSGKRQIFTPTITSMLAAQYQRLLFEKLGVGLLVRGEWLYLGEQYFDLANNIRQSPYQTLNAKAGFYSRRCELYFWTRNLTNRHYINYAYDFGAVHIAPPATFGATYRYNLF
jgi:iron complex outermembrane receptor protein